MLYAVQKTSGHEHSIASTVWWYSVTTLCVGNHKFDPLPHRITRYMNMVPVNFLNLAINGQHWFFFYHTLVAMDYIRNEISLADYTQTHTKKHQHFTRTKYELPCFLK